MLDLNGDLALQWNQITWSTRNRGIYRSEVEDKLIWKGYRGRLTVYVKYIYLELQQDSPIHQDNIFPIIFWKSGCSYKIIIFAWLVFHNKNLTWDNLQKGNWSGPAICPICKCEEENNMHIFLNCLQSQGIWKNLTVHFGFSMVSFLFLKEAFEWWSNLKSDWRPILLLTFWAIWKWRNRALFQNNKENYNTFYESILSQYYFGYSSNTLQRFGKLKTKNLDPTGIPRAYFDGAAQNGICACSVFIITMENQHIDIFWNGGKGSNNKVEAMALAGLLIFCDYLNIQYLQIFGVSKVIIDHVKSIHSIKNHNLSGWLNRIDSIWKSWKDYFIRHIDRAKNKDADSLSKKGLSSQNEFWKMSISLGDELHHIQDFIPPGT